MKIITRHIAIGILLSQVMTGVASAAVSAQLNRSEIHFGETLSLIIETNEINQTIQPDLSPLNKNFAVLGSTINQSVSIIDGKQTSTKQWIIELDPKAVGSWTIPGINVGNERTHPLRIRVLPNDPNISGQGNDIFVEIDVEDKSYYVQQQIIVTVKLYLGVRILDGSLSDPTPENTDVRRLGDDNQTSVTKAGRDYNLVERQFALFPSKSGELLVPPIRFQGVVQDNNRSGSQVFSNLFNQGKRVSATTESLTLNILPPSSEFTGRNWLPAKSLDITERAPENSTDKTELKVGQPFTREIELNALGLTAEQLPDISFPENSTFKQYPDKINRQSQHNGENILGVLSQSIAIIPSVPGEIALPEIRVEWWNTEADSMEVAILPEKVIAVSPDLVTTQNNEATSELLQTSADNKPVIAPLLLEQQDDSHIWKWLSLLLGLGWVSTLFYARYYRKPIADNAGETNVRSPQQIHVHQLLSELRSACKNNDPELARAKLQTWGRQHWPESPPITLADISDRLNSEKFAEEILELNLYLYGKKRRSLIKGQSEPWSGQSLMNLLDKLIEKPNKAESETSTLPSLYP